MTDFLLELRSEEIPARMQDRAREDLAKLFAAHMDAANQFISTKTITYATPRRLTLISPDLPESIEGIDLEIKGPKVSAPSAALEGFLRNNSLTQDDLTEQGGVWYASVKRPGRPMLDVLAEAIPAIVRAFPWPKAMRWGEQSATMESLRWVRPLQGIVALFGDDVIRCEIAGIVSGAATVGHRFHHPGAITIGNADDYVEKLRACHVIVDQAERRQIIALGATMAARKAGLELVQDEGLLTENAGLTEWPVPLLGRFDAAYLDVPPEVIQLTARVNQKYFVCRDADGKLANAFVCTANIDASDGGAKIVEGNCKVLAARLSDAKFFYDTDLKVPLEEQAKKLDRIVFHEKLGTVADKVERVAKLARWLVEEGIVSLNPLPFRGGVGGGVVPQAPSAEFADRPHPNPSPEGEGLEKLADQAERAARLCKADLVTGMVGEFPELQGLMGGYYARAQGEDDAVADAIRDHYKPVGQGDDVPTAPVTVAVSLADKLDTIFSFFAVDERPTGSKDPFALRRSVLGGGQIIVQRGIRLNLGALVSTITKTLMPYAERRKLIFENEVLPPVIKANIAEGEIFEGLHGKVGGQIELIFGDQDDNFRKVPFFSERLESMYWGPAILSKFEQSKGDVLLDFFADRLKVQQREAGVRHDLIDAVFALGGEDDLVRLLARVHALQAFIGTEDGTNLLAGYKRAANILKKEDYKPLPFRGGVGGGAVPQADGPAESPHPNPSPEGKGLDFPLSYTPEPAESALATALDTAEPAAASAIAREDFGAAMAALATLRAPIDQFFETVIVNAPEQDKRLSRLVLLDRVRAAVHNVADFSKIEG